MSTSKSEWRRRAREVIDRTLDALPPDAPPGQVRRVLWAAYPFGERANHPYKMYLAEVREAMKRRGSRGASGKPAVAYILTNRGAGSLPWLTVSCGWCDGKVTGGCLVCVGHNRTMMDVVRDEMFQALRTAVRNGDEVATAALGDYLEERLGTRCGI